VPAMTLRTGHGSWTLMHPSVPDAGAAVVTRSGWPPRPARARSPKAG